MTESIKSLSVKKVLITRLSVCVKVTHCLSRLEDYQNSVNMTLYMVPSSTVLATHCQLVILHARLHSTDVSFFYNKL